jgi:hypothetical protein
MRFAEQSLQFVRLNLAIIAQKLEPEVAFVRLLDKQVSSFETNSVVVRARDASRKLEATDVPDRSN